MMLAKTGAPLPVPDMTPGLPANDSLASDGAPAFSFQAVLDALQVATLAQAQEGIATEAQPNDETPPDTPPEIAASGHHDRGRTSVRRSAGI